MAEMKNVFYLRVLALVLALVCLLCACSVPKALLSSSDEILSEESGAEEPETESSAEYSEEVSEPYSEPEQEPEKVPVNRVSGNEKEIDAAVDRIFAGFNVVGGSVAAFEKGEVVYLHHYGMANRERGLAVTDDTRFRTASIAKAVTSLFAMRLVDEGRLDIDADICPMVNEKLRNPAYPNLPITTRQLMTHTSGLIDGAAYREAISSLPFAPLETLLADGRIRSGAKPGTSYVYTNFGMGLVSGVIESATGERFYDHTYELFESLGMDAAYINAMLSDKTQIATMYRNGEPTAEPSAWKDMRLDYVNIPVGQMYILGHGDLYISARDLARIGCIMAGDGTLDGVRVISEKSLGEMHTVQFTDSESGAVRGLGVERFDHIIDGKHFWGHQGNAYGMLSGLIYDIDDECGFVILTNSCSGGKKDGVYGINRAVVTELWQYFEPVTDDTGGAEE